MRAEMIDWFRRWLQPRTVNTTAPRQVASSIGLVTTVVDRITTLSDILGI
jgi:hypothetical protein